MSKVMSLSKRDTRDPASAGLVAGLVLAAVGLLIQVFAGMPGFSTIPPGPIILVVVAAFVAFAPWRWAPVVGLIAVLFLSVGAAVTPHSGIGDGWATWASSGRSRAPHCFCSG